MDISAAYRQLLRRVQMALSIGRVTAASDSGPIQKLQVQTPLEVRGDTPRMSDFGFSSGLPVGSDVVVAFFRWGSFVRRHYCVKPSIPPAIGPESWRDSHL
ncbi:phage baseplate assembly protein [Citrobacter freundii]|nr:phage baseplate assembly protein [Citrobacter freundii]